MDENPTHPILFNALNQFVIGNTWYLKTFHLFGLLYYPEIISLRGIFLEHLIKSKFGDFVRSENWVAQVNHLPQYRVHNSQNA